MGLLDRIRKKQTPSADERRSRLMSMGRITEGIIIDTDTDASGREIAYYVYTLNGVDFESSELLTDEQLSHPIKYAPGAKVGVRYDPRNQGNSVLE
jgi:hypothetical protein